MENFFKKILKSLNPLGYCQEWKIPPLECPQFLFLLMGIGTILVILVSYLLGNRQVSDKKVLNLIVLSVGAFLFIIDFIVLKGIEKMAQASRIKSEFINILSHQIRAPLTNLDFALAFILSEKTPAIQKRDYFFLLKENVSRMKNLVNNLLLVSRIEAKSLPLREKKVPLSEIIQKIQKEFKAQLDATNVKLEIKIEPVNLSLVTDSFLLQEILRNLLDNAIRYSQPTDSLRPKEKENKISLKVEERANCIYFEIKDTGVGIPKEEQKYIFNKFFRAKNVLKYQTEGTGLGLFITKNLVKALKGKIGFSSKENKGSTFWFKIPKK